MTLRKLIAEIIEDLNKYKVTDDNPYDYELIRDKIINAHQSVLNKFAAGKQSLESFYQPLPCIELECYQNTCQVGGFVFSHKTTYYKATFPTLFNSLGYDNIKYFGAFDFEKEINRVSIGGFMSSDGARFTSKNPIYTVIGDSAVIKGLPLGMSRALLVAILLDPTQACDWDDDHDFPTPSVNSIHIMVKQDIMSTQGVPDLINDAQIALSQPGAQKQKQPKQDDQSQEE